MLAASLLSSGDGIDGGRAIAIVEKQSFGAASARDALVAIALVRINVPIAESDRAGVRS